MTADDAQSTIELSDSLREKLRNAAWHLDMAEAMVEGVNDVVELASLASAREHIREAAALVGEVSDSNGGPR